MTDPNTEQQAAEFFARLANSPDLGALNQAEQASLVAEFEHLLARWQYPLAEYFLLHPSGYSEDRRLFEELRLLVHGEVFSILPWLLDGQRVILDRYAPVGQLQGRKLAVRLEPPAEPAPYRPYLNQLDETAPPIIQPSLLNSFCLDHFYRLLQRQPFPFGRCRVCKQIFIQLNPGKAKRYCSARCASLGVPSAANRAAYTLAWHQRERAKEITKARAMLLRWPQQPDYWSRLQREFPRKSRRQLLYLVKQANKATARKEE